VIRRRLLKAQPQKATQGQGIGGPPRYAALRIDALEVPDQQQPEVNARRQARPADGRGVERRTLRFDEHVEAVVVQDLIQPLIERMPARGRQLVGRDPQSWRPRSIFPSTHGHAGV
jgi:hypothetical protein